MIVIINNVVKMSNLACKCHNYGSHLLLSVNKFIFFKRHCELSW